MPFERTRTPAGAADAVKQIDATVSGLDPEVRDFLVTCVAHEIAVATGDVDDRSGNVAVGRHRAAARRAIDAMTSPHIVDSVGERYGEPIPDEDRREVWIHPTSDGYFVLIDPGTGEQALPGHLFVTEDAATEGARNRAMKVVA